MTTTVKFTTKPVFESVELIGKTVESAAFAGTVDRETIKRCLITEAPGFDGSKIIVGGDDTPIRSVTSAEVKVKVALGSGAVKSDVDWTLRGWKAPSAENDGVDFFVDQTMAPKLQSIMGCVTAMCAQHAEAAGFWKIVDQNGVRVFIRAVSPVDELGRVVED